MAIQTQGFSGVVDEVETATRARRVVQRPVDIGALGAYSLAQDNGSAVMAAGLAAGSEIYHFRWTNATNLAVLRSVRFSMGSVVAFVAGRLLFELLIARSWTVAGTGGTAVTPTANSQKKRTLFGTTLLGESRIASTAALGAGTKTLDGNAIGNIALAAPTTIGPIINPATYIWQRDTSDEWPVVLAQNEGLVIRASVAATGTWYFGVQTEWAELAAF